MPLLKLLTIYLSINYFHEKTTTNKQKNKQSKKHCTVLCKLGGLFVFLKLTITLEAKPKQNHNQKLEKPLKL